MRRGDEVDAVVVGSGPNGLAAAVVLAAAGLQVEVVEAAETIGGGARTQELTGPGFRHDVCSAVHPMALASPFFRAFGLAKHGVEMLQPEVAFAQPLEHGRAGLVWRDLDRTVDRLGVDGAAWRFLLGPLVARWESVVDLALSDLRSPPGDVATGLALARRMADQGSPLWNRRFSADVAPALLTGVSAHTIQPPRGLGPAGAGLLLSTLAHAVGWPIPRSGSQALPDAMARHVVALGGRVRTGERVESLSQLPRARAVLLDVTPRGFLDIAGHRLPAAYRWWLRRFRYGSGACKVDFALRGPVPWAADGVGRAGTVHLGGTRSEMVYAEREVASGRHARRPFVLVSQPGVVDGSRAPSGQQTLWTYAHVPAGSDRDLGDVVTDQIERFAPGFPDLILRRSVRTAAQEEAANANYVGGDIGSGATSPWQIVMRPVPRWDPYRTPIDGVYLCSASTPPGPGVHGMAGVHAARRALRQVFADRRDPLELVRTRPAL